MLQRRAPSLVGRLLGSLRSFSSSVPDLEVGDRRQRWFSGSSGLAAALPAPAPPPTRPPGSQAAAPPFFHPLQAATRHPFSHIPAGRNHLYVPVSVQAGSCGADPPVAATTAVAHSRVCNRAAPLPPRRCKKPCACRLPAVPASSAGPRQHP